MILKVNIFVQKSKFLSVEICQLKLVRTHVNYEVRSVGRHAYARTYFAYARACRAYARYARAYERENVRVYVLTHMRTICISTCIRMRTLPYFSFEPFFAVSMLEKGTMRTHSYRKAKSGN